MRIVSRACAALAAAVLVALSGLPGASVAAPPPPMVTARLQPPPLRSGYVEGEVLVKLREGGGYGAQAVERAHGLTLRRVAPRSNLRIYQVPAGAEEATAAALARDPAVEYAEVNARFVALDIPTDPLYSYQWNLPDVQAPAAWDLAEGDGVTVAVVDSGVDASHPDLADRVLEGWNTLDDNARWADEVGHGTHVAGIVAAVANNHQGVAGLAPRARILPVKALDQWGGTTLSVAEAIRWAADHGARVINLSLGGETSGRTLQEAVDYAHNRGALLVAAAGNCGDPQDHAACSTHNPVLYPASLQHVISVAATGAQDERAPYSEFNRFVDLAAPGGNPGRSGALSGFITSTYPLRLASNLGQPGYAAMAGTSMATPHVSAVAALVLARNPGLSPAALERLLISTADDLGAPGRDDYFGYGKVNALRAVQAAGNRGGVPVPSRSGWASAGGNPRMASVRLGTTRQGRASLTLRSARSYWLGVSTPSKENSRLVAGDPFAAGGVVPRDGAVWRVEVIDAAARPHARWCWGRTARRCSGRWLPSRSPVSRRTAGGPARWPRAWWAGTPPAPPAR